MRFNDNSNTVAIPQVKNAISKHKYMVYVYVCITVL